jgi:predicted phosphate transport protein (TIGR00153 family)
MFSFGPRKGIFFDLFDKAAQNACEAAAALLDLLEHYEDVPNKVRRIKILEQAGDDFTHQILERLAKTFITPLDREDIQRAASKLDDVCDHMDAVATRMMLYKIEATTEDARTFGQVLVKATGLLKDAFVQLRDLRRSDTIQSLCVEIHTQENEGDRLMQHALAGLFDGADLDAKEIIKWKDIYQILESATDRCEEVADVLQTIVVKHA